MKKMRRRAPKARNVPIVRPQIRLLNGRTVLAIVEIGSGFLDTRISSFPYGEGVKSTTLCNIEI